MKQAKNGKRANNQEAPGYGREQKLGGCPRTNMLVSGYQYIVLFNTLKALYIVGELVKR